MINFPYSFHRWQDKWFSIVITVGTYTKVHLLWVGVSFESLSDSQNGIRGSHLDVRPPRAEMSFNGIT